jgi:hypothetical protein
MVHFVHSSHFYHYVYAVTGRQLIIRYIRQKHESGSQPIRGEEGRKRVWLARNRICNALVELVVTKSNVKFTPKV